MRIRTRNYPQAAADGALSQGGGGLWGFAFWVE